MTRSDHDPADPLTWRIIHDPPAAGSWNMAVDEMMLERAASDRQVTLRFYTWSEPTLSLGYFQNLDDRQHHRASLNCPVVRRSTGGGAILHDHELTYSIAMPLADRWSTEATSLYDRFHRTLVKVLRSFGMAAHLCESTIRQIPERFLCFQRRASGDVLVTGAGQATHKVAGSAQRRKHGALVQHGSVILKRSPAAPEIVGLGDLAKGEIGLEPLVARWSAEVLENTRNCTSQWSAKELDHARGIQELRYTSDSWLTRRTTA